MNKILPLFLSVLCLASCMGPPFHSNNAIRTHRGEYCRDKGGSEEFCALYAVNPQKALEQYGGSSPQPDCNCTDETSAK